VIKREILLSLYSKNIRLYIASGLLPSGALVVHRMKMEIIDFAWKREIIDYILE
jgi:hypothetical protein